MVLDLVDLVFVLYQQCRDIVEATARNNFMGPFAVQCFVRQQFEIERLFSRVSESFIECCEVCSLALTFTFDLHSVTDAGSGLVLHVDTNR